MCRWEWNSHRFDFTMSIFNCWMQTECTNSFQRRVANKMLIRVLQQRPTRVLMVTFDLEISRERQPNQLTPANMGFEVLATYAGKREVQDAGPRYVPQH